MAKARFQLNTRCFPRFTQDFRRTIKESIMNSKNSGKSRDLINQLIDESQAYQVMDQMERYVDNKNDLSLLPIQPVYLALKTLPVEKVAELLPKFSKQQREVFLDIDLWQKDEVDIYRFNFWPLVYDLVNDDQIKREFVTSEQFLLFLKGKFNIWTFDVEDPNYPDHDHYFLTEDNQLLVEFEENYPYVQEVRSLIRHLYYELGVEQAYIFLFKLVSDSYLILQEEQYQIRIERMRDFGFVDYLEALKMENAFINIQFLDHFIMHKKPLVVDLSFESKTQNIHNSALVAFKNQFEQITDEILKVQDQMRQDYLQFNFVRLINARLESTDALKNGSVAMGKTGAVTKNVIMLGFNYVLQKRELGELVIDSALSLFDYFDLSELYRIGNSLLMFVKKDLKKALRDHGFESNEKEAFLGDYFGQVLECTFGEPVKIQKGDGEKAQFVLTWNDFLFLKRETETLVTLLPFAKKFLATWEELVAKAQVMDHFYLNYSVSSINLEALLMTSFANFVIVDEKNIVANKLGLTLSEYKAFSEIIFTDGEQVDYSNFKLTEVIKNKMTNFSKTYGFFNEEHLVHFLSAIIKSQMEGYDYPNLDIEEFEHVGGPIILNNIEH